MQLKAYLSDKFEIDEDHETAERVVTDFALCVHALLRKAHGKTSKCDSHQAILTALEPTDTILTFNYDLVVERALKEIADASGGVAYFPENVEDVHNICEQVAKDIRNQYTLAYYPSNARKDGTYRAVQVEIIPPRSRGKLIARTRNGYYAPIEPPGSSSGAN